jgi:hypothetical protein
VWSRVGMIEPLTFLLAHTLTNSDAFLPATCSHALVSKDFIIGSASGH